MSDAEDAGATCSDGAERTHRCLECGAEFATDPGYCTDCGSWDTAEIPEYDDETDT